MYACDLHGAFDTYRNNYYVLVILILNINLYIDDVGLKVKAYQKHILLFLLLLVMVNEASGQYFLLTNHQFI